MDLLKQIAMALQCGDSDGIGELLQQALDNKLAPKEILDRGLIAGMNVVGDRYKKHEIFLPEVLLAAKAMHMGMEKLKPLFLKDEVVARGRIVIGTVQGDIHDIGKNLVAIMLSGAGFEVIDLGKDVPPKKFIETAIEHNAKVIGMSALLTTTMPIMKKVVEGLKEKGLDGKIRTVIGGAPVSNEFAAQIGADGYGYDSVQAVDCIRKLISLS
ncbi:MAG: corrinoid protein [candidate division WOR-3 bacterium]|nr:MAG: corrinoid protein [candidate division WOR-3 bacterium]